MSSQDSDITASNFTQVSVEIPYDEEKLEKKLPGKSLFFFNWKNPVRKYAGIIVFSNLFSIFIMTAIVISSVLLAVENPLSDPTSTLMTILKYIDYGMTVIFTSEMILKIVTYGLLFNGKMSYLRNTWNIIDSLIVIVSLVSLGFTNVNLSFFKILRMLRVVRPIRMISKNEGLKISVMALLSSIPPLGNVAIVCFLAYLIFGSIAVTYFKGSFFYCTYGNAPDLLSHVVTKFDCYNMGGVWINKIANFDNIMTAMGTLFQMSTIVSWSAVMFSGLDAVGIDMQPVLENVWYWSAFFLIFIVFGAFFITNLFVGVVISKFN